MLDPWERQQISECHSPGIAVEIITGIKSGNYYFPHDPQDYVKYVITSSEIKKF
jgi:hypothetical protein